VGGTTRLSGGAHQEGAELRRYLQAVVDRGLLCQGVQCSASIGGRQVDVVAGRDGLGRLVSPATVVPLGTAALPVLGVAAGLLVQGGDLAADQVARAGSPALGIRDLLAGASDRRWAAGAVRDRGSSEDLAGEAWAFLRRAVSATTGRPFTAWFDETIRRPWCAGELWEEHRALGGGRPVSWAQPPEGPVGTARGLQRVHRNLLATLQGRHPTPLRRSTLMRWLLAPPVGAAPPTRLGGPGAGAGLVSGQRLGVAALVSPLAFGCLDQAGAVLGMADPEADLALGLVVIGAKVEPRALARLREGVVRLLYAELASAAGSGSTRTLPTTPASTARWASATCSSG